jgi:hypothetical protein
MHLTGRPMPARRQIYTLPPHLERDLTALCEQTGDTPSDVIADLVDAFLDDLAAEAERDSLTAADAPPPRVTKAGRGQAGGWRNSDAARRLAGLMEARRLVPGSRAQGS